MTPSFPTFSMASAMMLPTFWSPFAETVATWAISVRPFTCLLDFLMLPVTTSTDWSIPLLSFMGSCPAATSFMPSRYIAWASMVAVVVPSPATSLVFEATSFTIWAPMFSNLSSISISLATETPSLVTTGAPNVFSISTLRPLGPSVALTAAASLLTPSRTFSLASVSNNRSFAILLFSSFVSLLSPRVSRVRG